MDRWPEVSRALKPGRDENRVAGRVIPLTRVILALAMLLIVYIDPSKPERYAFATYLVLILYSGYSLVVLSLAAGNSRHFEFFQQYSHWLDLAWFSLLVVLSNGVESIFYSGLFFPILVASFRHGLVPGLKVAALAASLFAGIAFLSWEPGQDLELNRFLLRPTWLMVLGFLIAYWGGSEVRWRRQLVLLNELAFLVSARWSEEELIEKLLNFLRSYFRARKVLLLFRGAEGRFRCYRTVQSTAGTEVSVEILESSAGELLLAAQAPPLLRFRLRSRSPHAASAWVRRILAKFLDAFGRSELKSSESAARIAARLDAKTIASSSFQLGSLAGRIYIVDSEEVLEGTQLKLLEQIGRQLSPVLDRYRLEERIIQDAAQNERRRIARDLHDSVVQPFLAIEMGVASIEIQWGEVAPELKERCRNVREMVDFAVTGMRRGLVARQPVTREGTLLASIRRHAALLKEVTGFKSEIVSDVDLEPLEPELKADVLQIVVEALSNARRHSGTSEARLSFLREGEMLLVEIVHSNPNPVEPFVPRSIRERSQSLGGRTEVSVEKGCTRVRIELPVDWQRLEKI